MLSAIIVCVAIKVLLWLITVGGTKSCMPKTFIPTLELHARVIHLALDPRNGVSVHVRCTCGKRKHQIPRVYRKSLLYVAMIYM